MNKIKDANQKNEKVNMGVRDTEDLKKDKPVEKFEERGGKSSNGAENSAPPMDKHDVSPHQWDTRREERSKQQFQQNEKKDA